MNLRTCALIAFAMVTGGRPLCAQAGAEGQAPRNGLHVYRVTAYTGYTSLGLPNTDFNYLTGVVPQGADIQMGGAISMGWRQFGPRGRISLTYDPSYSGLLRHSEWNALNHSLSFNAGRRLGRRWDLTFAAAGDASSMYQFLFAPSALSNVAAVPASFQDLSSAMLSGRFTNDQLASVLTGAPGLDTPGRTVLYGNRVLTASGSTTVSYTPSARFSLRFGASASRIQYLNDGNAAAGALALLPRTVGGNASVGFSYSVTPRTEFGVDASANRTSSVLQDSYRTMAVASFGRRVGRQWFVQGRGGPAWVTVVRQTYPLPRGLQYAAGGNLGFRTATQTLLATADRTPTDTYGTSAAYTLSAGGTWQQHRPGSSWTFSGSARQQRMRGTYYNLDGWLVGGSVSKTLSRQTSVQITYTYLNNSGDFLGAARDIDMHAVQLAVIWREKALR